MDFCTLADSTGFYLTGNNEGLHVIKSPFSSLRSKTKRVVDSDSDNEKMEKKKRRRIKKPEPDSSDEDGELSPFCLYCHDPAHHIQAPIAVL